MPPNERPKYEVIEMRTPCATCSQLQGEIRHTKGQDCIWCQGCGAFQYNRPKESHAQRQPVDVTVEAGSAVQHSGSDTQRPVRDKVVICDKAVRGTLDRDNLNYYPPDAPDGGMMDRSQHGPEKTPSWFPDSAEDPNTNPYLPEQFRHTEEELSAIEQQLRQEETPPFDPQSVEDTKAPEHPVTFELHEKPKKPVVTVRVEAEPAGRGIELILQRGGSWIPILCFNTDGTITRYRLSKDIAEIYGVKTSANGMIYMTSTGKAL